MRCLISSQAEGPKSMCSSPAAALMSPSTTSDTRSSSSPTQLRVLKSSSIPDNRNFRFNEVKFADGYPLKIKKRIIEKPSRILETAWRTYTPADAETVTKSTVRGIYVLPVLFCEVSTVCSEHTLYGALTSSEYADRLTIIHQSGPPKPILCKEVGTISTFKRAPISALFNPLEEVSVTSSAISEQIKDWHDRAILSDIIPSCTLRKDLKDVTDLTSSDFRIENTLIEQSPKKRSKVVISGVESVCSGREYHPRHSWLDDGPDIAMPALDFTIYEDLETERTAVLEQPTSVTKTKKRKQGRNPSHSSNLPAKQHVPTDLKGAARYRAHMCKLRWQLQLEGLL